MKDIRLSLFLVSMMFFSLILTVSSFAKIDPKNIAGMWFFDEGGGDIAEDSSGNKNDGKLVKNPKWVAGKFGKALQIDSGTVNYVEIPDSDSLDITKGTFCAWIQVVKSVGENVILMKQTAYFWILDASGLPQLNLSFGGTWKGRYSSKTKVSQDTWTHIASTYDGSKVRFYLNGTLDAEVAVANGDIDISTSVVRIGERIDPQANNSFDGIIDEFVIFNDVLTEADIQDIGSKGLERVLGLTSVESVNKLSTTWATIKNR